LIYLRLGDEFDPERSDLPDKRRDYLLSWGVIELFLFENI